MKKKNILIYLILCLLVSFGIFISDFFFTPVRVKFAQISDIHIQNTKDSPLENTKPEILLKDAISQINNMNNIDFTLITGDIIDFPDIALFQYTVRIFNNLKKPWFYVMGNHDRNLGKVIPREELLQILQRENKLKFASKRYYSFHPKRGFTFIGLDGSDCEIDEEQITYLQFTIDENPDDVIVIFMHTPVVPPVDFIWHPCKNQEEVANILSSYSQPILVLAGHYHATKIIQQDNVIHVSSPSLRYAQEFRIISIKNYPDKTVFNFDYKETRLKRLITKPKKRYAGKKEDKYQRITIYKKGQQ